MNLRFSIIIPSFAGIIFFLFFFCSQSFASRSIIITTNKNAIFGDEEITLTASASGFTTGETIYVKGAFFNEGSTNYFGLTKYSDSFIKNGESTTTQRKITIGNWDQNLIVKPDFSDSGFVGENTYKLKIGFYYLTSGGNISPVNWSNTLDIAISLPDPTATPIIPTNTPILPSVTVAPTAKPTTTKAPTIKPTTTSLKITDSASISSEILGSSISAKPTEIIKNFGNKKKENNFFLFPLIGGIIVVISCGVATFLIYKKKQNIYE